MIRRGACKRKACASSRAAGHSGRSELLRVAATLGAIALPGLGFAPHRLMTQRAASVGVSASIVRFEQAIAAQQAGRDAGLTAAQSLGGKQVSVRAITAAHGLVRVTTERLPRRVPAKSIGAKRLAHPTIRVTVAYAAN